MLIPILHLKSQHTLHTYFGEQNEKLNSYNIFRYNLSGLTFQISSSYVTTKLCMDLLCTFFAKLWNRFDIIFNSNFIDLHEELFKLTEPFTGVSMRTQSALHRRSSDFPNIDFICRWQNVRNLHFFENRTKIRTFFENRTEICILFENRFKIYK